MDGFLGTGASGLSDLTLLVYLFLLTPGMLLGFVFARRKMFVPHHKLTMTAIVVLNWVLIIILMFGSYGSGVAPYLAEYFSDPRISLPTLHAITGGLGQLLATYLALRMWFEKVLPPWIMVKNIKLYMRITLSLWLISVALGVVIYFTWYTSPAQAGDGVTPAVTAEPASTDEPTIVILTPAATEEVGEPVATEEPAAADETGEPVATEEPAATEEGGEPVATEEPAAGEESSIAEPAATEEPVATEEVGG